MRITPHYAITFVLYEKFSQRFHEILDWAPTHFKGKSRDKLCDFCFINIFNAYQNNKTQIYHPKKLKNLHWFNRKTLQHASCWNGYHIRNKLVTVTSLRLWPKFTHVHSWPTGLFQTLSNSFKFCIQFLLPSESRFQSLEPKQVVWQTYKSWYLARQKWTLDCFLQTLACAVQDMVGLPSANSLQSTRSIQRLSLVLQWVQFLVFSRSNIFTTDLCHDNKLLFVDTLRAPFPSKCALGMDRTGKRISLFVWKRCVYCFASIVLNCLLKLCLYPHNCKIA